MFYLTTHSTHFYLRLYGVRHMVKDHTDSEKGNPLPPHRLLLSINSKGSFICTIPQTGLHIPLFVTPVVEHWLEREIAQWVHPMKDRSDDPSHHERTLYFGATSRSEKKKEELLFGAVIYFFLQVASTETKARGVKLTFNLRTTATKTATSAVKHAPSSTTHPFQVFFFCLLL